MVSPGGPKTLLDLPEIQLEGSCPTEYTEAKAVQRNAGKDNDRRIGGGKNRDARSAGHKKGPMPVLREEGARLCEERPDDHPVPEMSPPLPHL